MRNLIWNMDRTRAVVKSKIREYTFTKLLSGDVEIKAWFNSKECFYIGIFDEKTARDYFDEDER